MIKKKNLNASGIGYVEGGCHYNSREKITFSTALIRDRGIFDGVKSTAYELGHL